MISFLQQFAQKSNPSIDRTLIDALDLDANTPISIIGVMTAQPKYLVFTDRSFPDYVLQFGDYDALSIVFNQTEELSLQLPGCVPHPVTLINYSPGIAMLVQTGLEGKPWFNLRSKIKTESEWIDLVDRIISSLTGFQQSVRNNSKWKSSLAPGDLLVDIARRYKSDSINHLPVGFDDVVEKHSVLLKEVAQLECVYQHGDFCINNLLIADERISIMDFEHFGEVQMPLHDEFMLLRSLMHFYKGSSESDWLKFWSNLADRAHYENKIQPHHVPGFFLHFLLWWILETNTNSRRTEMAQFYKHMLVSFCVNEQEGSDWHPCAYFDY